MNGIRDLLREHAAADAREEGFRAEMLALCDSEGACSRHHYVPGHFTASAFVVSPDGDEVLMIHHSKLQRWLQPGGHFEDGDPDAIAAALREVVEETGVADVEILDGLFDVDVHEIPARPGKEPAHRHYDLRVLLRARDRAAVAGSDALAVRWVRLGDVSEVESDASVMRAVHKLRELG